MDAGNPESPVHNVETAGNLLGTKVAMAAHAHFGKYFEGLISGHFPWTDRLAARDDVVWRRVWHATSAVRDIQRHEHLGSRVEFSLWNT